MKTLHGLVSAITVCLMVLTPVYGQRYPAHLPPIPHSSGTAPAFKGYAYGYASASNSVGPTSTSLSVTAGDRVFVFCGGYVANSKTFTVTGSSGWSGTFTAQSTVYQSGYQSAMMNATAGASGSYTFYCTPSVSMSYQTIIAMDYSPVGTGIDSGSITYSYTCTNGACGLQTSGTFSVARSTVLFCVYNYYSNTWTAGSIGSNTATVRASDTSTATTGHAACEDYASSSALSSVTATMTFGYVGNHTSTGSVTALDY